MAASLDDDDDDRQDENFVELKSPTRAGPFDTSKEDVAMAASKSLDNNVSIDMERI